MNVNGPASFSFLNAAENITLAAYYEPRKCSVLLSELVSRVAAALLLSAAAALDVAFHSLLTLPTFIYALGKSAYYCELDLTLPWQHLQRVRNAVAPLLLGSCMGILHPLAGVAVSEPTDKYTAAGILVSNTNQHLDTPCSPVHSLSIIEDLAKDHRYEEVNGERIEIFSPEHTKCISEARQFEEVSEALQAQEFIHKITNITLFVMAKILQTIEHSNTSRLNKEVLVRVSGLLVPVLTAVDLAITLFVQTFFLVTGVARLVSGRGPIYTEVTTNPLMHLSFLVQNLLKATGTLVGTAVWFAEPLLGFKVSLIPANLFFKLQLNALLLFIRLKMDFAENDSRFALPIVYGTGECEAYSIPAHTMHKTYLIVEKHDGRYNLYWVDRPSVSLKQNLSTDEALSQIQTMFDERYPFMDIDKVLNYPVKSKAPAFPQATRFATLAHQGNSTTCVVSNLFGMLETLDLIQGQDARVSTIRNRVVRRELEKAYNFYANDVFPMGGEQSRYSLKHVWQRCQQYPDSSI